MNSRYDLFGIQTLPSPSFHQDTFDSFKKNLPASMRKEIEKRQKEQQKIEGEREEREELKLSQILDQETLFRFAYIPFVIANLAWDYADTIILMATQLSIDKVKKISRAIRDLKREYDRFRSPFIDDAHRKSEEDNMYVFEDGVKDLFKLYLVNIECDIRSEYPELTHEYVIYLKAIHQCHIVLQSIFYYAELQTKNVEKIVGHKIGQIIPPHLYRLDRLVLEYVGDKPISESFQKQQSTYSSSLANRMAWIELSEVKDPEQ